MGLKSLSFLLAFCWQRFKPSQTGYFRHRLASRASQICSERVPYDDWPHTDSARAHRSIVDAPRRTFRNEMGMLARCPFYFYGAMDEKYHFSPLAINPGPANIPKNQSL